MPRTGSMRDTCAVMDGASCSKGRPEAGQNPEGRFVISAVNSGDGQTIPLGKTVCLVAHRLNRLDKLMTQCDEFMALSFS